MIEANRLVSDASLAPHACATMVWLLEDRNMPVVYSDQFREYNVVSIGDSHEAFTLSFCPQDGVALPPSLRQAWFDLADSLGLDVSIFELEDPSIPLDMRSGAWWRNPTVGAARLL
jgi:hypothetical protein